MLAHIAITVNDQEEIKFFYENILLFSKKKQYVLSPETSQLIFNIRHPVDVYMMEHNTSSFEIFVSRVREKKIFSHICLALWKSENAYKKAIEAGYRTIVKNNPDHDTYFIWDKSGNLFEIKEITE